MFLSHLTKRLSLQLLIFDQLQADVVLVARAQPADLRLQALVLVALQVSRDLVLLQLFRLRKFELELKLIFNVQLSSIHPTY